jgi:hypothetical protein
VAHAERSTSSDDARGAVEKTRELDDGSMLLFGSTEQLDNRTMYLVGLQALHHEHVILAKLTRFLAPRRPLACRVDCVYYDSKSFRRGEAERPITELRNPDGSRIWRMDKADAAPAAQEMPFRLKGVVPQRSRWRCHLAQVHLVEEEDPRIPIIVIGAWSTERRFVHPRAWLIKREALGLVCGPDDHFQDEAVDALLRRRGGIVIGRGSTGKSEVLRRLVARLKERDVEAHVVTFTHVAAQNAEGGTILHELYANKRQKQTAICIDEASMVSMKMWAQLAKLHFTCAMVATGRGSSCRSPTRGARSCFATSSGSTLCTLFATAAASSSTGFGAAAIRRILTSSAASTPPFAHSRWCCPARGSGIPRRASRWARCCA